MFNNESTSFLSVRTAPITMTLANSLGRYSFITRKTNARRSISATINRSSRTVRRTRKALSRPIGISITRLRAAASKYR